MASSLPPIIIHKNLRRSRLKTASVCPRFSFARRRRRRVDGGGGGGGGQQLGIWALRTRSTEPPNVPVLRSRHALCAAIQRSPRNYPERLHNPFHFLDAHLVYRVPCRHAFDVYYVFVAFI